MEAAVLRELAAIRAANVSMLELSSGSEDSDSSSFSGDHGHDMSPRGARTRAQTKLAASLSSQAKASLEGGHPSTDQLDQGLADPSELEAQVRKELQTDSGLQRHLVQYYGPSSKLAATRLLKALRMPDLTDYSNIGAAVNFVARFNDAITWTSVFVLRKSDIGRMFLRAIRPRPLAEWIQGETTR